MLLCYVVENILTLVPEWGFDKLRLYKKLQLVLVWCSHEVAAPSGLD